jgi:hypothetical protein
MTHVRGLLVGVIAVGAVCTTSVTPVGAAQPVEVSVVSHTIRGCPDPGSCTFVASGAITDSGTVTTEIVLAVAVNSPVTGAAQYVRTFHGQAGTFTIRLQSRLSGTDVPWLWQEDGEWTVIDASGDYTGMLGRGSESGIRDFQQQSLDAVYAGTLQLP